MKLPEQKRSKDGYPLCPLCDKGHDEIRGMGMVVNHICYCFTHGKILTGDPRAIKREGEE